MILHRVKIVFIPLPVVGFTAVRDKPLDIQVFGPVPIAEVTQPIGLISDTQIHESRGTAASRYFSNTGDEIVEVTVRTGQQVIGSTDILWEVLNRLSSTALVIPKTRHRLDCFFSASK